MRRSHIPDSDNLNGTAKRRVRPLDMVVEGPDTPNIFEHPTRIVV
jgi:hypothetical protein